MDLPLDSASDCLKPMAARPPSTDSLTGLMRMSHSQHATLFCDPPWAMFRVVNRLDEHQSSVQACPQSLLRGTTSYYTRTLKLQECTLLHRTNQESGSARCYHIYIYLLPARPCTGSVEQVVAPLPRLTQPHRSRERPDLLPNRRSETLYWLTGFAGESA
jgi:hypothetical protein